MVKDDFILLVVVTLPLGDIEDHTLRIVFIASGLVIQMREMLIDNSTEYLIILSLYNDYEPRGDSLPSVMYLHGGEIVPFDGAYSLIRYNINLDGLIYEVLQVIKVVDDG